MGVMIRFAATGKGESANSADYRRRPVFRQIIDDNEITVFSVGQEGTLAFANLQLCFMIKSPATHRG